MAPPAHPSREIVIRFVRWKGPEDRPRTVRAAALLDRAESAALGLLGATDARRDHIMAHALARLTLAELAGCAPERLRFRPSPSGRREVVAPRAARGFQLSLSRADGVALCAVARPGAPAVGAVVESVRRLGPDVLGIARVICSDREQDRLRALPPAQRPERLLSLWARKEATARALGPEASPPFAAIEAEAPERRIVERRLSPHHLAAVAVLSQGDEEPPVRFEEVEL